MSLALASPEILTVVAVVALLVGVPLFVIAVVAVYSGYVQHDATRRLEELEADEDRTDPDRDLERREEEH